MLTAELKVVGGKHNGTIIPLTSKKFLIGREQDCQLRPNSELISRHHCAITLDDYSVRVRDFGSTNGTFVNGTRVKIQIILNTGDRVGIGTGTLEFEITIHKASQAATPDPAVEQSTVAQSATPQTASPLPTVHLGTPPPASDGPVFEISLPHASQPDAETAIFSTDAATHQQTTPAPTPVEAPPRPHVPATPAPPDPAAHDATLAPSIKVPPPGSKREHA